MYYRTENKDLDEAHSKQGAYEIYLILTYLKFDGYGDPDNEADYSEYCYPGTITPVSVETGKKISVLA